MIENSSSEYDDDDAKSTIFTFYSASDSINDKSIIKTSAAKKKITQPELQNNESFQSRVTSNMTSYHSLISNFSLFSFSTVVFLTISSEYNLLLESFPDICSSAELFFKGIVGNVDLPIFSNVD